MLVGNNYTCFVFVVVVKTIFEIGCWSALVTRYEEFKITISSIVQKNEFVHAFTDRVLLIMYSCQIIYIHFLTIQLRLIAVRILCFNGKALSNFYINHLHSFE